MAWSELVPVPNEYNDEFRTLDEAILNYIQQRKSLSDGKRIFPPQEIIQEWSTRYGMDVPQIHWFMHNLNHSLHTFNPNEPGELLNVIPIMKKTVQDGFEYLITHAMQHENESIVSIEVRGIDPALKGVIRTKLLLKVKGEAEYHSYSRGSRGSGRQAQLSFSVRPRLPDGIEKVEFSLLPFASPMEDSPKEIILDRGVVF